LAYCGAGQALIADGELEQIQFLLGHVSVQTTEHYLGCKQRFRNAVNDRIGLEPDQRDDAVVENLIVEKWQRMIPGPENRVS
jgi:hypothetical protein